MTRHTPQHEVELYREEDSYVVIVELPGANADDVDVARVSDAIRDALP